jgi:hypothetical protein
MMDMGGSGDMRARQGGGAKVKRGKVVRLNYINWSIFVWEIFGINERSSRGNSPGKK